MSEMQNWELGQKVAFDHQLERKRGEGGNRHWEVEPCEPIEGVYMGHRVVFNGHYFSGGPSGYSGYYEAPHFEAKEGVPHAIVVVDKRKAPIRVPYEHMEATE